MGYFTDPHNGERKFFKGSGRRSYKKYNDDPLPKDPKKRKRVLNAWEKIDKSELERFTTSESVLTENQKRIEQQNIEVRKKKRLEYRENLRAKEDIKRKEKKLEIAAQRSEIDRIRSQERRALRKKKK